MILKAVKTSTGKEYRKFDIRGAYEEYNEKVPMNNQSSIEQLQWSNEMMRREIWSLKERLSRYETIDRTQEPYYARPSAY